MPKSSIIIPVFNHAALTERCVNSLGEGDFEIIVVDDASTDSTADLLRSLVSRVKSLRHASNQGFSATCNDGAEASSGEYLVFLNNDTLTQPGWLDALIAYADLHPRAAVVGSRLLYPDNTVQHAGVVICQDLYPRHIYTGFPAGHPAVCKSRQFQIVTGACMLVRRQAFIETHGFDLSFRNGFEDVDLCLRLREAGWEIHYCAESIVQHLESVSPGRFKHDSQNLDLYRQRWMNRVRPDDAQYYLEDGLLQFSYEGAFPFVMKVSPRLAVIEECTRGSETEKLLEANARCIADLRKENTRLAALVTGGHADSEPARYQRLRHQIRELVRKNTPAGAKLLVVSKGDRALLEHPGRQAGHFPQTAKGTYAGHHPADGPSAIVQLELLRDAGADYLLFPATALWWLEYYRELEAHLDAHYRRIVNEADTCVIFELRPSAAETPRAADTGVSTDRTIKPTLTWPATATPFGVAPSTKTQIQ